MRRALLTVCLGLMTASAEAHYVDLEQALIRDRVLTFGLTLVGKPFSYRRDGTIRGFEVEVARAVAAAHDLELRLVRLARDELKRALDDGRVDAVNSLALAAEDRALSILPYLRVGDHVMILKGNPFRIRTPDDLSGRVVAATSGSSAEIYARALNDRFLTAGRPAMHIHTFPEQRHTHFPVSMGHASAYFMKSVSAVGVSRDPHARTRLLPGAFQLRREAGFALKPDNRVLHHAVEHAIAAMVATGKHERLMRQYGLPIELSPFPRDGDHQSGPGSAATVPAEK